MKIINKRAKFDYQFLDRFEAGIVLSGGEVKQIRRNNANINQAHAKFVNNELFLINANITIPGKKDYSPTRPRKLLLHKSEVTSILTQTKAKNLTIIPIRLYTKDRLIKAELALAKFKRQVQKKESTKKKDIQRDIERELKNR